MRSKTQSSKVSSSQRAAWGASSFSTNEPIDSRSRSCSSVKMKCFRFEPKSGLMTFSAVAMGVRVSPCRAAAAARETVPK